MSQRRLRRKRSNSLVTIQTTVVKEDFTEISQRLLNQSVTIIPASNHSKSVSHLNVNLDSEAAYYLITYHINPGSYDLASCEHY